MPDDDGYQILSQYARDTRTVLHHPCDRHIRNTTAARRAHLADCPAAAAAERRRAQVAADAAERLRQINEQRGETRRHLTPPAVAPFEPGAGLSLF